MVLMTMRYYLSSQPSKLKGFILLLFLMGLTLYRLQTPNPKRQVQKREDLMATTPKPRSIQMIQKDRKALLDEECAKTQTNRTDKTYLGHVLVDDKHKVLYCYVPKAGCTTWRTLLVDPHSTKKIPDTKLIDIMGKKNLIPISFWNETERQLRLKTYFKFTSVRHPLTRLVAVFKDKFSTEHEFPHLYESYVNMTIEMRKLKGSTDGKAPFTDFVNYIFSTNPPRFNMHWNTMEKVCQPCIVKYDFIGKMETFTRDSEHVLSTAFKSNITLPHFGVRTATGDSLTKKLVAALPTELREKVLNYYSQDAKFFGYDMKPYL